MLTAVNAASRRKQSSPRNIEARLKIGVEASFSEPELDKFESKSVSI